MKKGRTRKWGAHRSYMCAKRKCARKEERSVQVTSAREVVIHSRSSRTSKEADQLLKRGTTGLPSFTLHTQTNSSLVFLQAQRHIPSLSTTVHANHLIRTQSSFLLVHSTHTPSLRGDKSLCLKKQLGQYRPAIVLEIDPLPSPELTSIKSDRSLPI